jgi:hypothetical protein
MKFKLNKKSLENKLLDFLVKEKACVGPSMNITDPSQYSFLLGQRSEMYTLLKPTIFLKNLRTSLHFLESMVKYKEKLCFIVNINDPLLCHKLEKSCNRENHYFYNQNTKLNHLMSKKKPKAIVALFIDSTRLNVLYTEARSLEIPIICFTTQINNFFSSNLQILGSFKTKSSQNLLISLIILSLKSK